MENKVHSSFV